MRFLAPDQAPKLFRTYVRMLRLLARGWRPLLFRTQFIAITGSLGKTIAKECLAGILAENFSIGKTFASQSAWHGVPLSVLRIRPRHRFAVMETGAPGPGSIDAAVRLVRPRVALVLTVNRNHSNHYGNLSEIAAEKGKLVASLPPDGIAVLNADVAHVRAMQERAPCAVFTFGRSAGSDLLISNVEGVWPERLRFRATYRNESAEVKTRLIGEHQWTPAAGALATAVALGVELPAAASALSRVEPHTARLEPVQLPNGAVVLRDELGAVPDSFECALQVLAEARGVQRRVAVLGLLSDSGMRGADCADLVGRKAAGAADAAVFVGRYANRSARAAVQSGMNPECARAFKRLEDAAAFLRGDLREGDLVLLKGRVTEHLARIYHAQLGTVKCWTRHCRLTLLCDYCPALGFQPFQRSRHGDPPPGPGEAEDKNTSSHNSSPVE